MELFVYIRNYEVTIKNIAKTKTNYDQQIPNFDNTEDTQNKSDATFQNGRIGITLTKIYMAFLMSHTPRLMVFAMRKSMGMLFAKFRTTS